VIIMVPRLALATLVVVCLTADGVRAQDALASARTLYASAQYDEALKLLDQMASAPASSEQQQSIELYRTLCLLAIGRRDDADRAIETIIARNPLYRPGDEMSPRTRSAFSEAKKRVLPSIVQQQYAEAKSTFDRKAFETAAVLFKRVIDALGDPDIDAAAAQPPLSDLRTLAAGFYDLSVNAIPPPAPPPPPPAPVAAAPAVVLPPKVYGPEDRGVRAPVTIMQDMPRYPGAVPPNGLTGIVEVVINENGVVESASMVVPLKPLGPANASAPMGNAYDKMVLSAAKKWQFQPAVMDGAPVKYRKRIQISIQPPTM
jgi:tetratricopeptide (TPR) repeat protein